MLQLISYLKPVQRQLVCLRSFSAAATKTGEVVAKDAESFPDYRRKLIKRMIENVSPAGTTPLVQLFQSVRHLRELQSALKVLRLARRYRNHSQQHQDFPAAVGAAALQKALDLGQPGVASYLLKSQDVLGIKLSEPSAWFSTLEAYRKKGDVKGMYWLWRHMPKQYARPSVASVLVKGCVDNGHMYLASKIKKEFEVNGVSVPQEALSLLEGGATESKTASTNNLSGGEKLSTTT